MSKHVRTVLGDIFPEKLGPTLSHEHLFTFPPQGICPDLDYKLNSYEKALQEVGMFKEAGGGAIAEMTTLGYGRDVDSLRKISDATGVHIICATGFIKESYLPREFFSLTEAELTRQFISEVKEGVENSGIKAGVIKVGASYNKFSEAEKKVARAACKAHLETGAPISTHTSDGTMALNIVEFLQSERVDLNSVAIGHLDKGSLQLGYILMIARAGVYVQFDNIGKTKYYPDDLRVDILKQLIKGGVANRILLSGDQGRQSYLKSYGGGPGFEYLLKGFIPLMRKKGISEEGIRQITVENPKNFFAF